MGKSCFVCGEKFGIISNYITYKDLQKNKIDTSPDGFEKKDVLCRSCGENLALEKSGEIIQWSKDNLSPEEYDKLFKTDPLSIRIMEKYLKDNPEGESNQNSSPSNSISSSPSIASSIQTGNLSNFTSADQLRSLTKTLHDKTKSQWDKNGVVQFKDEALAILQRMWGQQVQFIVACSQLSKEGYRLMAIDEGKSGGQASGGFTGGVNAYFYFQKIDYVK